MVMAPSGARPIGLGICNLASALPRHVRPSGMVAFPIKVAVSRIIFRGGSPSGANPMWTLESADGTMKRALSCGTRATTNATAIVIVGGDARVIKNARVTLNIRLAWLGSGFITGGG